jgi:hypothetical protein
MLLEGHVEKGQIVLDQPAELPEGARVRIEVVPAPRAAFDALLAQVPDSEAAWATRQSTLRSWRADSRFEPYWAVIDHMLTVGFPSFQRIAGIDRSGLDGYDFDAYREQRDYDLKHSHDHIP